MDRLFVRYVRSLREQSDHLKSSGEYQRGAQIKDLNRLSKSFLLSPNVWEAAFDIYSEKASSSSFPPTTASTTESTDASMDVDIQDESEDVLRTIFNKWRLASPSTHGDAALKWAGCLSSRGKGSEAAEVIASARIAVSSLGGQALEDFENRWRDVLDRAEENEEDHDEDEGDKSSTA